MKIRSKLERLQLPQKKKPRLFMRSLRDMTIPVVELQRFFRRKINKGRKVLYAVVTE